MRRIKTCLRFECSNSTGLHLDTYSSFLWPWMLLSVSQAPSAKQYRSKVDKLHSSAESFPHIHPFQSILRDKLWIGPSKLGCANNERVKHTKKRRGHLRPCCQKSVLSNSTQRVFLLHVKRGSFERRKGGRIWKPGCLWRSRLWKESRPRAAVFPLCRRPPAIHLGKQFRSYWSRADDSFPSVFPPFFVSFTMRCCHFQIPDMDHKIIQMHFITHFHWKALNSPLLWGIDFVNSIVNHVNLISQRAGGVIKWYINLSYRDKVSVFVPVSRDIFVLTPTLWGQKGVLWVFMCQWNEKVDSCCLLGVDKCVTATESVSLCLWGIAAIAGHTERRRKNQRQQMCFATHFGDLLRAWFAIYPSTHITLN